MRGAGRYEMYRIITAIATRQSGASARSSRRRPSLPRARPDDARAAKVKRRRPRGDDGERGDGERARLARALGHARVAAGTAGVARVGGEGPRVQHPEPRQREETEVEEPVGERARGGATEDALAVAGVDEVVVGRGGRGRGGGHGVGRARRRLRRTRATTTKTASARIRTNARKRGIMNEEN